MMNWSTADALKVYNLPYWGGGFFHLDEQGRVVVAPDKRRPEHRVALVEIVDMLRQQGLATPLLLRLPPQSQPVGKSARFSSRERFP